MHYRSTRGDPAGATFDDVLLAGLAPDGGLYMPETWPTLDLATLRGLAYPDLAAAIIHPFLGDTMPAAALRALCHAAYATFPHPAIVPLVQLETGLWVQELFHGPTLAFKDLALQLLARLFDHVLEQRNTRLTVIGATSGDTGPAAIAACAGHPRLSIAILHPRGRTSEVQRRQMTTFPQANVLNLAVDGSFDACQDLVKALFADATLRRDLHLSAVNSINWGRIAAQIPYYVAATLALGGAPIDVAIPTGNFGNVLAAWIARRMGAPIRRLIVASNRNDILARFLAHNDMTVRPVEPSLSPSMDIQVSSNFERLLFELLDRDPGRTAATMHGFRATGRMAVPDATWHAVRAAGFEGFRLDDAGALAEIARLAARGTLADPHTATAIAAARALRATDGTPMVAMATAHPAKFPDTVTRATGQRPPLPASLADLYTRPERCIDVPAELDPVQAQLRAFALRNAA